MASIREFCQFQRKLFFLLSIFAVFITMTCNRMPSGPAIPPQESKLAVFCVLNPGQQTQTVLLQRTLTFDETVATSNPDLYISDAQIILEGPDGQTEAVPMLHGSRPSVLQDVKHGSDFLWGSGNFNYLLEGQELKAGEQYSLSIATEGYGSIQAETTIPGPFQITEINIEQNLSSEPQLRDLDNYFSYPPIRDFRVTWTESPGAAGYLVDIVLVRYDLSQWGHYWEVSNEQGEKGWARELILPDSVDILEVPYEEIPLTFETSHGKSVRGFLTHELKYETSVGYMKAKLQSHSALLPWFDTAFYEHKEPLLDKYMFRLQVTIHALSKSLFAFTAFQYLNLEQGRIVGQEIYLPDLSNVKDGAGVFGASSTQTAYSRLGPYGTLLFMGGFFDIIWGTNDVDLLKRIPQNLQPDDNAVLVPGGSLVLSWDVVPEANLYVLVLKPYYLWFYPGNYVYLLRDNQVEIFERDLSYRDCRLEWYVAAIREDTTHQQWLNRFDSYGRDDGIIFSDIDVNDIFTIGPGKGPMVLYGYYGFKGYEYNTDNPNFLGGRHLALPHSYSLWSESRFIDMPSGEIAGFEGSRPVLTAPQEGASMLINGTLQWQEVSGADAYLVYIHSGEQTIIAASQETEVSPPFPDECEWADGLRGVEAFESGKTYTWQVCALRVKSGTLGFAIDLPQNGNPPRVYPRYQHPSGIMQTSQWSEERRFLVQ